MNTMPFSFLLNNFGEDFLMYVFDLSTPNELTENLANSHSYMYQLLASNIYHNAWLSNTPWFEEGIIELIQTIQLQKNAEKRYCYRKDNDFLLDSLNEIMYQIWPIFLYEFNVRNSPFIVRMKYTSALSSFLLHGGKLNKYMKIFAEDKRVNSLLPELDNYVDSNEEILMFNANWSSSLGSAGSINIYNFIADLLYVCATTCAIKGERIEYNNLCNHIKAILEDWVKLANGEMLKIKCLLSLNGTPLSNHQEIVFNEFKLRAPSKEEKRIIFSNVYAPELILEKEVNMELSVFPNNSPVDKFGDFESLFGTAFRDMHDCLNEDVKKLQVSMLLASPNINQEWYIASENTIYYNAPFVNGSSVWERPKRNATNVESINCTGIVEIEKWYKLVKVNKVKVSIEKLVSSVSKRNDAKDSLLDAVTAWEGLFGSDSETVFKVTAALAKLIGNNYEDRIELQKALKKIYNTRSRIVHGSDNLPAERIQVQSIEAIEVTIKALKILFMDREDLLEVSTEKRAEAILLE